MQMNFCADESAWLGRPDRWFRIQQAVDHYTLLANVVTSAHHRRPLVCQRLARSLPIAAGDA